MRNDNELTKDELQIILLDINSNINKTKAAGLLKVADSYIDLRDKIQAMIDNYCEHINTIDDSNMFTACQDCHAIW